MKTITVVTPSYNKGEFIEKTIQSVLSQQGDFYIDYIIMDGGSRDQSVAIIKKYEHLLAENCEIREKDSLQYYTNISKDKNFQWNKCLGISYRWKSERDKGQTHAINKGFRMAKGQIVSWINSDDAYCNNAFNIVTNHFSKHLADDFVYGDGEVVDENGKLQWEWLSRPYDFTLMKSYHFLWNDFSNYIMQQATFWKRSVFARIGYLDESFHFAMDVEYWLRAGANGLILTHIPEKLGKFRMISGSKSLSSPTAFWPDMLDIFKRYNGAAHMAPFFAYYFYNISLHNGFDLPEAWQEKVNVLKRWQTLGADEIKILEKQAQKGFKKACLLTMNRAFFDSNRQVALNIFKNTTLSHHLLVFHPLTFIFMIKCLLGRKISKRLNTLRKKLIRFYRQRKYQYRYLERRKRKTHE